MWTLTGAVLLAVATAALVVRYLPLTYLPLVVGAALAPYLMLAAPLAAVVFAAVRRWLPAGVAVAVTLACVLVQLPLYRGVPAPPGTPVRFMTANLRYGHADPGVLVRLARENADIVAVQELTPQKAQAVMAAGMDGDFPYHALQAREGPAGVGIWSRYPIGRGGSVDGFWLGLLVARVRVPRLSPELTLVATHMSAPWPGSMAGWRADLSRLGDALRGIAGSAPGPILVGGDLNATTDMRPFRALLVDGYHDAAAQAGAGITRTHPADIVIPPLFAVDHILTRDATATSVRTLGLPGSDHRALAADVVTGSP